MIPPLFARFLRDTLTISFEMRKKGRGHKNKSCLRAPRPIIDHRKSSNPPGFRVSPPPRPPTLNFGKQLPPLCLNKELMLYANN